MQGVSAALPWKSLPKKKAQPGQDCACDVPARSPADNLYAMIRRLSMAAQPPLISPPP